MRYLSSVYDPPVKNLGLDFYPQNPYGFTTKDNAIYFGVDDPVFYEKSNFTPRLTQQDTLDLIAGKKVVATEKQPGYSKEDLLNAYREARDRFDKQEEELAKVQSALPSFGRKSKFRFENLHRRNPKYPYNYYWFPAANTSSVLQQDDLKELGRIKEELNNKNLSEEDAQSLRVKRDSIMKRAYNQMMDFDNYHTNQSTIRPDGKRYLSPELAMESIFRNSGRRMERQAGAYYLDRDFPISKKLGKFDYEKFKTDSGYRKEVTDEYLKIPGVRESLAEYMKSPLEYKPSFSGGFLPSKMSDDNNTYFHPRSNTINLDYAQLLDYIRNEGERSSEDRISHTGTRMPNLLDHEYSHLENEYLKNVTQKLLDEYIPKSDPIGRRIEEDDFYRKLNEVYPQQRLLEGLAENSPFVNSPLSENPRIKQKEGDNTDWLSRLKKTQNPDAILGHPIDVRWMPFARSHEQSSSEIMSDVKAIQEYMTANPEYEYDYTDPNSFFTKQMFNKLIKDDNVKESLSFYRILDRYRDDFSKLEKLINFTSNEQSTPSYMPNRRFFPSAGEYSYS